MTAKSKPEGYWKSWENVEAELRTVIEKLGHFPSSDELAELNMTSLGMAIGKHGGYRVLRERMGYEQAIKPSGYWNEWGNLEKEIRAVVERTGHFPNSTELSEIGMSTMNISISRHGGYYAIRQRMGYDLGKKPRRYWRDWKNVELELRLLVEELGHFPTQEELVQRGNGTLAQYLSKYYGGVEGVREKIGASRKEKPSYWRDWKNVEGELKTVIWQLKHFPSSPELRMLKKSMLGAAISRYHGGFDVVRERMGYESTQKPNGFWQDWKNVEAELKKLVEELGHFPNHREMRNYSSTLSGAVRDYGGIHAVAERIGHHLSGKRRGFWKSKRNIISKLEELTEELGHFPNQKELSERGLFGLITGFRRFGGVTVIKKEMGIQEERREKGYWQNWSNVERELGGVIEKLGHFPTQKEMQKYNPSLASALNSHEGIDVARERMGYVPIQKPDGFWKNWGNLERELKSLTDELGHFPTSTELKDSGENGVLLGINKYHGGIRAVRKKVGIHVAVKREDGYWQDWNNYRSEMEELIEKLGHFPSHTEIKQSNSTALSHYARLYGGIDAVREKMGIPPPLVSTTEKSRRQGIKNAESFRKNAYNIEGRFYASSQQEGATALLLERYIPGYKVNEGKTFQVRDRGINNGGIDFLVQNEFLEWHPIILYSYATTRGDIPKEEADSYKKVLATLPEDERAQFKKDYARVLAINYRNSRQASVDNSKYKGANVALATDVKELYDFIARYNPNLPAFPEFTSEFRQMIKHVKQFKVEKAAKEAA